MAKNQAPDMSEKALEQAKKDYRLACDYWAPQHKRMDEDIAFQIPENQWTEEAKVERKGRPMMSISLLQQPMQLVQNQAANAKLGVNLHPASEKADRELAEIKQGLLTRIQRDGGANSARLWALDYAKQAGLGWYRIDYQWDEDGDDEFDLEIVYRRILNQKDVLMDPSAQEPDFSDARWCYVRKWMTSDSYEREYGKLSEDESLTWADMAEEEPDWVIVTGEKIACLVLERFYKTYEHEEVVREGLKRKKDKVCVRRAVMNAVKILEDEPFGGVDGYGIPLIPIVPVVGRELQPMNGERRWEGMVRPARDAQRIFNWAISSMVEDVSRLSKVPYIGAEGQFAGHEDEWLGINTKNRPYVEYRTVDIEGKPAERPSPMQIDGTKMQLSDALATSARDLVHTATAVPPPALGDLPRRKEAQSGRAILALQQQSDASTSNYLQNFELYTLPYDARVVLALLPSTYSRPGRVTQILGGEDESRAVMLGAPFVVGRDGRPIPADMNATGAKTYNLSGGKYAIVPSVGKSFQTRLEQGATEMGEILTGAPDLMPVIGDLYFKFRDFPGAKEISERLASLRGGGKDQDGQQSPEAAKAQVQAMGQQMQMLEANLKQAMEMIQTDRAKQEAVLAKAQIDNQTKMALAKLDEQAQAREDALKLKIEQMKLEFEERKMKFEAAHDVGMAAAGSRTVTSRKEGGQETGEEREGEESQGRSSESAQEAENRPEAEE